MSSREDQADALGASPARENELTNAPNDRNGLIKEQKEILWALYQDNLSLSRNYESQRVTVSNIILLTSVAIVGVMGHGGLTISDWPLTCVLIPLGVYGAVFTSTYFASICRYQKRAKKYYRAFASFLKEAELQQGLEDVICVDDCEHDEALPKFRELSWFSLLRTLWPLMISLIGMAATAYLLMYWPMSRCGPCTPG